MALNIVSLNYYPGNLALGDRDLKELNDPNNESLNFSFLFDAQSKIGFKQYDYNFRFNKDWLNSKYMIVSIINLKTRKLKRTYRPVRKEALYNIQIDFGNYKILSLKD